MVLVTICGPVADLVGTRGETERFNHRFFKLSFTPAPPDRRNKQTHEAEEQGTKIMANKMNENQAFETHTGADNGRFNDVKRDYSMADVKKLSGSVQIE
jgi:hypothetical protein